MLVITAITPIFVIILCGYFCRYLAFAGAQFWRGAERLTYYLLLPALLVNKIATADIVLSELLSVIVVVVLTLIVVALLLMISKPCLSLGNPQFSSVFQGGIRFNSYVGLALVLALYGERGLVIAVVIATTMILVVNLLCVWVLELYSENKHSVSIKQLLKSIITNPLIIACTLGLLINILLINVPLIILETLAILGRSALPLGLLTVGAALSLKHVASAIRPILLSSMVKFLLLPLVAMLLCYYLHIDDFTRPIVLVMATLPTATTSYLLAKQLGGDYTLMATIITVQTFFSMIIIPIALALLEWQ